MRKIIVAGAMVIGVALMAGCKKKEEQPPPQPPAETAVAPSPATVDPTQRGADVFKEKCASCHAVNGVGGTMGTDLSKVGANRDAEYLLKQIEDPKSFNKESKMPSFADLPKEDKDAVVAYMLTLK